MTGFDSKALGAAVVAGALSAMALTLSARGQAPAVQGGGDPVARAAGAQELKLPPLSNMAQLMRGVYFTNSNLIFTVQTRDPGAPPESAAPDAAAPSGGFSFVDWGAGIYTGWQLVDNAAAALADASTLLVTPGRLCENGRPVPVTDPEWITFTQEMYDAALVTYKASQARSQQAVSDATGQLSDACFNCHSVYRDRRGGRRGAPPPPGATGVNAGRCVSRLPPA